MKITALMPVKTNSTRLANKNFLDFCGQPLYRVMLDKLQELDYIDQIIINTDAAALAEDCRERYSKAVVVERPEFLRADEITMNSLIAHDITLTESEHFLQTHCTNPLLTKETITKAIDSYFEKLPDHDSLLSVERIRKRGYFENGQPINHLNQQLLQTQDLDPICIENSNLFLFSRTSFIRAANSRVGKNPQLFPMNYLEGIDIDYAEDFHLAALLFENQAVFS
jgi:CMP-N-acetylneuraminic acid synthetase